MSSGQINDTLEIRIVIDADATSGFGVLTPRPLTIVDVIVLATATSAGGTLQVGDGTVPITDAIACATADAVSRAATIDGTYATLGAGRTIEVTANGAADRGEVVIICHAPGAPLDAP